MKAKTLQPASNHDGWQPSSSAICSAVFASENLMAISGPCGHVVPIESAMEGRPDQYSCPTCGLRYHIEQEPPKIYPSGFVMPGKRKIVIDAQGGLPALFAAIEKAGCYDTPLNSDLSNGTKAP